MIINTFYEGPHEGQYEHLNFLSTLTNVPHVTLKGKYNIPSKDGKEGEIGIAWHFGHVLSGGRVIYTVRYTKRTNRMASFLKGSEIYGDVRVEVRSTREKNVDTIETILGKIFRSEQ